MIDDIYKPVASPKIETNPLSWIKLICNYGDFYVTIGNFHGFLHDYMFDKAIERGMLPKGSEVNDKGMFVIGKGE